MQPLFDSARQLLCTLVRGKRFVLQSYMDVSDGEQSFNKSAFRDIFLIPT